MGGALTGLPVNPLPIGQRSTRSSLQGQRVCESLCMCVCVCVEGRFFLRVHPSPFYDVCIPGDVRVTSVLWTSILFFRLVPNRCEAGSERVPFPSQLLSVTECDTLQAGVYWVPSSNRIGVLIIIIIIMMIFFVRSFTPRSKRPLGPPGTSGRKETLCSESPSSRRYL